MFSFLDSFWKRTYKYYNFHIIFFASFVLAVFAAMLQRVMNSPFVTIVVLLSCILNSTKETDAYMNLKKFKTFHFTDEHVLKLGWFLYFKRNKFVWVGLFYSGICVINFPLFVENISLIIIASYILFSNLSCNKWSERIGEIHLVILIILITFDLGYYFSVAMNGLFCSGLCMLLIPVNKGGEKSYVKIRNRLIFERTPLLFRYFILEQWKANLCLVAVFILPKIIMLFQIKILQDWAITINFTGIFMLLIIFELIQDINLEKHHLEYNRLRFYKLSNLNFFWRVFFSRYMSLGGFTIFLTIIINLFTIKIIIIQVLLVFLLVLWYKFFEEKALLDKRKPTWQLSYIRCWAPATLLFLVSFAPQLIQFVERVKGR